MPIVGCGLAMCDGDSCKEHEFSNGTRGPAREVVPLQKATNGQMAVDPPQGWTARMRSVVVPGKGPVELLCPACQPAKEVDAEVVRVSRNGFEYDPGTR